MATNRSRVAFVQHAIVRWFAQHQRDLPWRHTRDPYKILVSEVMLQQTGVGRVIPKYREFLRRFPSVRMLARATPRDVLLVWAGMGYNRRALYLYRMARAVMGRFRGRVPQTIDALRTLPGVGPYTAAAVATFSTGTPHVLADTNVKRVIGRVFGGYPLPRSLRRERALLELVARTLPYAPVANTRPALWGHALMDFGALVCRAKPRCGMCPLTRWCKAYPRIETHWSSTTRRSHTSSAHIPDRIYRGRILVLVRTADPRPVRLSDLTSALGELSEARVRRLVSALVSEGLLARRSRSSVLLPISERSLRISA